MHKQQNTIRQPLTSDSERALRDMRLMEQIAAGDETALAQLYEHYSRPVFSLAYRILGDTSAAEEVIQDTFLRIWTARLRFDPARGTVSSWLLTITHHRAIDELRQQRRQPILADADQRNPLYEQCDLAPLPEEAAIIAEHAAAIRAALNRLPASQRQAIELAYFHGLSHREIARTCDEPEGTVKARVRRGMQALKQALGRSAMPEVPAPEPHYVELASYAAALI